MPTGDDVGGCCSFEPTHGVQALLAMAMVALNAIVEVLRCPMLNTRQSCAEGRRIALGFVGRNPFRPHTRLVDRPFEESLCCLSIAPLREVSINDVAILVD